MFIERIKQLDLLSRLQLTKIRGEWNIAEMTEKTRKLFAQIGVVFPAKLE